MLYNVSSVRLLALSIKNAISSSYHHQQLKNFHFLNSDRLSLWYHSHQHQAHYPEAQEVGDDYRNVGGGIYRTPSPVIRRKNEGCQRAIKPKK